MASLWALPLRCARVVIDSRRWRYSTEDSSENAINHSWFFGKVESHLKFRRSRWRWYQYMRTCMHRLARHLQLISCQGPLCTTKQLELVLFLRIQFSSNEEAFPWWWQVLKRLLACMCPCLARWSSGLDNCEVDNGRQLFKHAHRVGRNNRIRS